VDNHLRPGQRNPIEGKFGQGKLAYGMNLIRAQLKETSESRIACIALVLNLVRLAGKALFTLTQTITSIPQHLFFILQPQNQTFALQRVN
jgi:hypothetical protein